MSRASSPRGEEVPTTEADGESPTTSLESWLALSLCAVVLLASLAFLRRANALSRALLDLGCEVARAQPAPRRPAFPGGDSRPDLVILISLDTLRADRLDLYGYGRETAPNLH